MSVRRRKQGDAGYAYQNKDPQNLKTDPESDGNVILNVCIEHNLGKLVVSFFCMRMPADGTFVQLMNA